MANQVPAIDDELEALVTYFVMNLRRACQPMGRTKLVKLLYFADLYHVELFGKPVTGVPYRHYYAGPFSERVYEAVGRLQERGIFVEEEVTTRDDRKAYILKPKVKAATVRMTKSAKEVADMVLEEWGPASASEIEAAAKRTIPFLKSRFNEQLDLSDNSLDEWYQEEHRLPSPGAAATELIIQEDGLLAQIEHPEKKPVKH